MRIFKRFIATSTKSILVLNSGSSSLKFKLFANQHSGLSEIQSGIVANIGNASNSYIKWTDKSQQKQLLPFPDHKSALDHVSSLLDCDSVVAIGHRVVHGGPTINSSRLLDEEVLNLIQEACEFAPLHNPAALSGISLAQKRFPDIPQVAVFDTSFHTTIPPFAKLYAISPNFPNYAQSRFGFHGTSVQYCLHKLKRHNGNSDANAIVMHLGAGCSVTAVKNGKSIETSMGATPMEGIPMATRCGDLDPGIILRLCRQFPVSQVDEILNKQSGITALSGCSDFKTLEDKLNEDGCARAQLAMDVFIHGVRKYLGAYLLSLDYEVNAIIFTGGFGENSPFLRSEILQGLDVLGITLNEYRNRNVRDAKSDINCISTPSSKSQVFVIRADEEYEIARHTLKLVQNFI